MFMFQRAELGLGRFEQIPEDLRGWNRLKKNQDISSDVSEDERRLFFKDKNLRGIARTKPTAVSGWWAE